MSASEINEKNRAWDITKPLFNQFFIIGPQDYEKKPSILRKNENFNYDPVNLFIFPAGSENKGYGQLLLPFGTKIEDVSYNSNRDVKIDFASKNEILEEVTFYKVDGGDPVFIYAIIFKTSPFSLPAILNPLLLDAIRFYRDSFKKTKIPIFKCAFAVETVHPFHTLFFSLLRAMIEFEFQVRNTKMNLQILKSGFAIPFDWDPSAHWPCSTFFSRQDFLNILYTTSLPVFGETIAIKFGDSLVPNFTWRMPERNVIAYSPAEVGYKVIMSWIKLEDYISMMEATLLSFPIAVIGNNFSDITKAVSFIPNMIMPFLWSNPAFSIAPKEKAEDFLTSCVPILFGIFSDIAEGKDVESEFTMVIIDNQTVEFFSSHPQIPGREELEIKLESLFQQLEYDVNFDTVKSIFKETQNHLYKYITKKMESCLIFQEVDGENKTIFDNDKFKSLYSHSDFEFINKLIDSQNFKNCAFKLCDINTALKSGLDMSLEGLGGWSASIQQMLDEIEGSGKQKKRSPAQFLNLFDPYG